MKTLILAAMMLIGTSVASAEGITSKAGGCRLYGAYYPNGAQAQTTIYYGEGQSYTVTWTCVNGRWQ